MRKNITQESVCIHGGSDLVAEVGMTSPIYPSSAYRYRGVENTYPRYFNTNNQKILSAKLALLEKGEDALVFSSGMAAISTTLLSFLKNGDHVLFSNQLYGGTYHFILQEFSKRGISYTFVDGTDLKALEGAINQQTKLIYIESPSNPLLQILDIVSIAKFAQKHEIISVIDNTFASPINQNPIEMGIDIVLHSGTKYLGGHSDLCFGAAISSKAFIHPIFQSAINYGGSLNALDCYLIERSLKTLSVRVKQQNENALQIATFLEKHSKVAEVFYPGLTSHLGHQIAKEQMRGFGGMMAFTLKVQTLKEVGVFLDALQMIAPALSLGGVETIICSPVETSHIKVPKEEREATGITDNLLRLSIGIENPSDIIDDLERGFDAL